MTDEEKFKKVVLERIVEAIDQTGHSFFGLLKAIQECGAIATARRLIALEGDDAFQDGMIQLKEAGLLKLSIEQAVIEFGERGEIFTIAEVDAAKERLEMVELVL